MRISAICFTPLCVQAVRSAVEMGREALLISGVSIPAPAQNSRNPSAVVLAVTDGTGNGPDREKCSATSALNGKTVEDPTTMMWSRVSASQAKTANIPISAKTRRHETPHAALPADFTTATDMIFGSVRMELM
jgi:hypothetical protein